MHGGQIQEPAADAERRRVGDCRVQLNTVMISAKGMIRKLSFNVTFLRVF